MTIEQHIEDVLTAPMTAEGRSRLDARVGSAIESAPARPRRRIRIRRSLVLVAVALVVPVVGVGAAIMSTESPYGLATATEFAAELEAAKAEVPLPAGRIWPAIPAFEVDPDAGYSRGGGRSTVEGVATCIWLDDWLDARQAGDAGRVQVAARTIAAIPTWPSWTSPFWTESYTDHLQPIIDAVAGGMEAPVRSEMRTNCEFAAD
jgi:hypothetical protein